MTRPLDPLPDARLDELDKLHSLAPEKTHDSDWHWNGEDSVEVQVENLSASAFYQAAREMLPSLLAEVRAARAGRDATPAAEAFSVLRFIVDEVVAWTCVEGVGPMPSALAALIRRAEPFRALAGRDARASPGTVCPCCGACVDHPSSAVRCASCGCGRVHHGEAGGSCAMCECCDLFTPASPESAP